MDERRRQNALLRERPTSEVQVARLTAARDAIREQLAVGLGLTAWSDRDNRDVAGCSELDESAGRTVLVSSLLLTGGVPDAVWPQAVNLTQQAAAAFGFGAVDVVVDRPGEHEIVLRGQWGALLRSAASRTRPCRWRPAATCRRARGSANRTQSHQPRARHSGRLGRSAPSVVSLPWPG